MVLVTTKNDDDTMIPMDETLLDLVMKEVKLWQGDFMM
jgi:hypothetical protein